MVRAGWSGRKFSAYSSPAPRNQPFVRALLGESALVNPEGRSKEVGVILPIESRLGITTREEDHQIGERHPTDAAADCPLRTQLFVRDQR